MSFVRSLAIALALASALAGAGCTASDPLARSRGLAGASEPYYKEYTGAVEPNMDRSFELAVEEGASLVNVTLALTTRSGGVASAAPTPAQLEVQLVAPDGSAAKKASVTAERPAAVLLLDAPAPGAYKVRLSGSGLSGALQGSQYGATYVLILQTEYI